MLHATTVNNHQELEQIYHLNQQNLKQNLPAAERAQEGFVTWWYTPQLLQQLHQLAPSIVVKDGGQVVGYALVTLPEARSFHPDLNDLFTNLQQLQYRQQPLFTHSFYCMGQVCIDKAYRGKGVFQLLYQEHYNVYHRQYNLLITEISVSNPRSQRAHEKVGFQTIHTFADGLDKWNVVVWDWNRPQELV